MAYADFYFTSDEIAEIQQRVAEENEVNYVKQLLITNANQEVFTELEKTIYISSKAHYKQKLQKKKASKEPS